MGADQHLAHLGRDVVGPRNRALAQREEVVAGLVDRQLTTDPPKPGTDGAERLFARLASPDALTARSSTFGRGDVLEAICNELPNGGRVDDIVFRDERFPACADMDGDGIPDFITWKRLLCRYQVLFPDGA